MAGLARDSGSRNQDWRYEPGVQRTYEEFAQHNGTIILLARPARARDKARVEVAVQLAERWIVARLRHETFFSLAALNTASLPSSWR